MATIIDATLMPATRLELRWRKLAEPEDGYTWFCDYDLVLELNELDIRGEVYDDNGALLRRLREKRLSLGGTRSTGNGNFIRGGEIRTPYRDHAHILWDGKRLGLPGYVVFGDKAMLIESKGG